VGVGWRSEELLELIGETIFSGEAPGAKKLQQARQWYFCCTHNIHEITNLLQYKCEAFKIDKKKYSESKLKMRLEGHINLKDTSNSVNVKMS
jgi:hypothetical protein